MKKKAQKQLQTVLNFNPLNTTTTTTPVDPAPSHKKANSVTAKTATVISAKAQSDLKRQLTPCQSILEAQRKITSTPGFEDEFEFDDTRPKPNAHNEGKPQSTTDKLKAQMLATVSKVRSAVSSTASKAMGGLFQGVKLTPEEYCAHPAVRDTLGWKAMDLALSLVGGADPDRFANEMEDVQLT